ncbi:hypothetical protein N7454_004806 [Penicillium verhagenii]|nr:hypothetical protein N7454_004806 [Penicillium verhagenii]
MEASTPQQISPTAIFVDNLIQELAEFQSLTTHADEHDPPRTQGPHEREQPNPLSSLPASHIIRVKPLMLTLHCLFPNDLLPALDILDRRLVRRLVREERIEITTVPRQDDGSTAEHQNTEQAETSYTSAHKSSLEDVFFVISASTAPLHGTPSSAFLTQELIRGYEVRLHAWACTCPTFTLAAFRDIQSRTDVSEETYSGSELRDCEPGCYPFGGTLTCVTDWGSPPVCKHILACILLARCPGLFGESEDDRHPVSMQELAGWCAGWGG